MNISEITYQGNKSRLMKILKPLIENNLEEGMVYIEPFGGGMNSFTPINSIKKIANDVNEYNIALWLELKAKGFDGVESDWNPYLRILSNCEDKPNGENFLKAKALYLDMKLDCLSNGGKYPKALLGFVAYSCSFGGGWWNGFAGYNERRGENYIKEAIAALRKQVSSTVNIENSDFTHGSYDSIDVPDNAFIYCDPPYAETKKYANSFDNDKFWDWCRNIISSKENVKVLVSEYNAPSDFVCIWSRQVQDKMGKNTMSKNEKLFIHNSQVSKFNLSSLPEVVNITTSDIKEMVTTSIKKILAENVQSELQAFHGSSADFNNFDLSFVGSGEGSQVYGYGVYLTNVRDTGRWYAATIAIQNAKKDKKNVDKGAFVAIKNAKSFVERNGKMKGRKVNIISDEETFQKNKGNIINVLQEKLSKSKLKSERETYSQAIEFVNKCNTFNMFNDELIKLAHQAASPYTRYVYYVDIPDDNGKNYIDWNNTNREFITYIFNEISKHFDTSHVDINTVESFGDMYEKLRGWRYKPSKGEIIPQKNLSLFLYSLNYDGIKVQTGNKSGGDGRGFNYIIFNENDVKIINKVNMAGKTDFDDEQ